MSDEPKTCLGGCGSTKLKGKWCTAGACKKKRALVTKMKKEALVAGPARTGANRRVPSRTSAYQCAYQQVLEWRPLLLCVRAVYAA